MAVSALVAHSESAHNQSWTEASRGVHLRVLAQSVKASRAMVGNRRALQQARAAQTVYMSRSR